MFTQVQTLSEVDWDRNDPADMWVLAALTQAETNIELVEVTALSVDMGEAECSYYTLQFKDGSSIDALSAIHIVDSVALQTFYKENA